MTQKITNTSLPSEIATPQQEATSSSIPSAIESSLQELSNTQIQSQCSQTQDSPEPPLTTAQKDALPQLNAATQNTAKDIAHITASANTVMEGLLEKNSHEQEKNVDVDEKTLNYIKLIKDFTDTPLDTESAANMEKVRDRLHQLTSNQVPLPNEAWAKVIEDHVNALTFECVNAIGMHEHITCLQDIFKQLETVSKEDFITIANYHLRFAWQDQEGLEESAKDAKTKDLLCKTLGEMFIRSQKAGIAKENAPLSFIEHISTNNLANLSKLCMISDISIDKLIYGMDEACKHMTALYCPKGKAQDASSVQKAQDVMNTYLDAIFSTKQDDFPTTLRYVDALFQHIYPKGQELALQLKMALAPHDFNADGIRAQHNLTLSMQDLMHSVSEVRGKSRSAAIQRAATSAKGSVPAFWLTPSTVNTITHAKVKDLSFRLAHIALLQMEAHDNHAVYSPLAAVALSPKAETADAQDAQGEHDADAQSPPTLPEWQNAELWCKHLGLDAQTETLILQLQEIAENEGINVGNMTLQDARELFDKGMSGVTDFNKAHASTRSTSKIVRHDFFNENHKTLYATMGEGVTARMAMRDALVGMLQGTVEEQHTHIENLNFTTLEPLIKEATAKILPPETQAKNLRSEALKHVHGLSRSVRDFLYQQSVLTQKKEDLLIFKDKASQRAKTRELAGEVSFFAPQLSRDRQVVCHHIVAVQKALTQYMQNQDNAEYATALKTAVTKLRTVNPKDLKNGTPQEAIMSDLVDRLETEITPRDIQLLENQLEYLYPQAQAIIELAPFKVDPENPHKHGSFSTFIVGTALSAYRKAHAISDWLSLKGHDVASLFWKATDWTLVTRKTQHVQKLVSLATLKTFADTEGARASDFKLSDATIQSDIHAHLRAWGLDPEADAIQHIVKRCLLDFSNPNGSIHLENIRTKAYDLAKQSIRQHEQDTQHSYFIPAEFRARSQAGKNHLTAVNAEAFSSLLDTLSHGGGAFVYNRTRGIKFDAGAIHSPLGRFSSKTKRYLLPASVNAEVARTKGIAVMPLGTGFRVMFKNSLAGGAGASVNWKIDPAKTVKATVGANVDLQKASGVAVDFKDKETCLEFLQLLTPHSEIHNKQTDLNLHSNIFSRAQEVHFLDEDGATLRANVSLSFLGITQELLKSTACLIPSASLAVAGGFTRSRQQNAHGEVVKLANNFTFMGSASLGFSKLKEGNIPGIDVSKSTGRKALSKTVSMGVITKRTVEIHTKDHALLPSTCIWWDMPTQGMTEFDCIPDDIVHIINTDKDIALQFAAAYNKNPASWSVQYSLKPHIFEQINTLMGNAHVAQDPKQAQQYMDTVHKLVCANTSYAPAKLIAKCMTNTPVSLNMNPGALSLQAVMERNAMMEKPIVIPLSSEKVKA